MQISISLFLVPWREMRLVACLHPLPLAACVFQMKVCTSTPGFLISNLKNHSFTIPLCVLCGIICYLRFSYFTTLVINVYFRRLSCVSQKVQYYSLGSSKIFKGLESSQRPLSSSASYLILILVFALMVFKYITRPYVLSTHTCTQASACSVMCMHHMFLNTEEDTKIQLTYKWIFDVSPHLISKGLSAIHSSSLLKVF